MPSPRIDVLKRLNAAFNAGDPGWTDYYTEDAEFRMPPDWPDDAVGMGPEAIARIAGQWMENLDDYGWDEERLIETPECVVGLYRHHGLIKGTDKQIETRIGALFYFQGDQVCRVQSYSSWEDALATAGVEAADLERKT